MDCSLLCSPPGSAVHGTFQARILEWDFPPLGNLPNPGSNPHLLCLLDWQAGSLLLRHLGSRREVLSGSLCGTLGGGHLMGQVLQHFRKSLGIGHMKGAQRYSLVRNGRQHSALSSCPLSLWNMLEPRSFHQTLKWGGGR